MQKRHLKNLIREYGFLAEPCICMTETEALRLTDESGVPSFERIAAKARARSALPDKAWEPVKRVAEKRDRSFMPSLRRAKAWAVSLSCILAATLFFTLTPPGKALVEETVNSIEKTYRSIIRTVDPRYPERTEDTNPVYAFSPGPEQPPEPSASPALTAAPTAAPEPETTQLILISDEPAAPSAEPAVTPFMSPTAEPAEPTAAPTFTPAPTAATTAAPKPEHTCGQPDCTDGSFNHYACCSLRGGVHVCSANFPDDAFRGYVSACCDLDRDGVLDENELNEADSMNLDSMGIASLEGIGFFKELTTLWCRNNGIDSIDLRRLPNIDSLLCDSCAIGALDLSGQTKLFVLSCSDNPVTELKLSGSNSLTRLNCSGCLIKELEATSACLDHLDCSNNRLEKLTLSFTHVIHDLDISGNRLRTLELCPLHGEGVDHKLSPQDGGSIACIEGAGYYDFDFASFLSGGLHQKIREVRGVMEDGSEVKANYHGRKGIARFNEIPRSLRYYYDTGAGLMEVAVGVVG